MQSPLDGGGGGGVMSLVPQGNQSSPYSSSSSSMAGGVDGDVRHMQSSSIDRIGRLQEAHRCVYITQSVICATNSN